MAKKSKEYSYKKEDPVAEEAVKAPKAKGTWVKNGCSIICKKGIVGPGTEVTVDMVKGGAETIEVLLKTVLTDKEPVK